MSLYLCRRWYIANTWVTEKNNSKSTMLIIHSYVYARPQFEFVWGEGGIHCCSEYCGTEGFCSRSRVNTDTCREGQLWVHAAEKALQ